MALRQRRLSKSKRRYQQTFSMTRLLNQQRHQFFNMTICVCVFQILVMMINSFGSYLLSSSTYKNMANVRCIYYGL